MGLGLDLIVKNKLLLRQVFVFGENAVIRSGLTEVLNLASGVDLVNFGPFKHICNSQKVLRLLQAATLVEVAAALHCRPWSTLLRVLGNFFGQVLLLVSVGLNFVLGVLAHQVRVINSL